MQITFIPILLTAALIFTTTATAHCAESNVAPLKLACIGASITAGVGTANPARDSFPAQLATMLGAKWQVRNFGVSGTTLLHSGDAPYVNTDAYKQALAFVPDVLIIDLGGNDSKPQNFEAHPQDFVPDYQAMAGAFRQVNPHIKIYAAQPVPAFPENYGIRDSIIVQKIMPAILQATAEAHITVIDLHTPMVDRAADFADKVHPNAAGAKTMAEVIYRVLQADFPLVTGHEETMDNKVFVGYQGWATPLRQEDGAKWVHFGSRGQFKPGFSCVEMWPDTSDLDADEKVPTDFRLKDGSVANVFDAQNGKTVNRHFAWMKQYDIDGAFLQRFVNPAADAKQRPALDRVLKNVRDASKANGVEWGMMYDLSGVRAADIFPKVSTDWKYLVGELKIRDDAHYIHHRNRPVVVLWGVGFNDNRPAPSAYLSLIQFLKNDPVYGGNTVILGVPFYWRTQTRDTTTDPSLFEVLKAADVIAPWPVGRYGTPDDATRIGREERAPDVTWAAANKLDYLPGAFPGFSWFNLMKTRDKVSPFNQIPRLGGRFLWAQAVSANRAGAKMLYIAMFDEIDEGTAIFKVSNDPPVGETPFVTYEGLPTDHYMWLAGQIGKMLRGEIPAADDMPKR